MVRTIVAIFVVLFVPGMLHAAEVGDTVYSKNENEAVNDKPGDSGKASGSMALYKPYKVKQKAKNWLLVEGPGATGWVFHTNVSTTKPAAVNNSALTNTETAAGKATASQGTRTWGAEVYPDTVARSSRTGAGDALRSLAWLIKFNDGISEAEVTNYQKAKKLGSYGH